MNEGKAYPLKNVTPLKPRVFDNLVKRRFLDIFGYEPKGYDQWSENEALRKEAERKIFERINDTNNLLPINFLSKGLSKSRAVCRIAGFDRNGEWGGLGTGFLIAPGIIMTNNHVIERYDDGKNYDAEFFYEEGKEKIIVKLKPEEIFISSDKNELDFTIIGCETKGIEDIEPIKLLRNPATITRYEYVNIIQHPNGRKKEVALQDNEVIYIYDKVIHYTTDTEPGSSGSAVFNNSWELVALHHAGFEKDNETGKSYNEGIRISTIVDYLVKSSYENINNKHQVAKVLDSIEDTSPYLGYFDLEGLTDNNVNNIDINSTSFNHKKFIDIGFWNIGNPSELISDKKIASISNAIGKLSMDILGLEGIGKEHLEKIVDITHKNGINMSYLHLDSQTKENLAILFDLETTNIQIENDTKEKYAKIFNGKINFNNLFFVKCSINSDKKSTQFIMILANCNKDENLTVLTISTIINDLISKEKLPIIFMCNSKLNKNNKFLSLIEDSSDIFTVSSDEVKAGLITYISNTNSTPIQQLITSKDLKIYTNGVFNTIKYDTPLDKIVADTTQYYPIVTRLVYDEESNNNINGYSIIKIKINDNLNDQDLITYAQLKVMLNKNQLKDPNIYYNEDEDKLSISEYYKNINFETWDSNELFFTLNSLITKTHVNQFSYKESRYKHLYPLVDLRPNGELISIYSNNLVNAEQIILEDFQIEKIYQQAYANLSKGGFLLNDVTKYKTLEILERDYKFNCEHAVPQAWFNSAYPMKSDLHHLFVCESSCNSSKSNYPYYDFIEYNPNNSLEGILKGCGMAEDKKFEPESSKGVVARATLYFLLRYPKILNEVDEKYINLLLQWHNEFPTSVYEKHRNKTIFEAQRNRNPLIDFPYKSSKINFYLSLK